MKKIFSVLLASFLTFGLTAFAQDIHISKGISEPDNNGVYTLSLDAYLSGTVTVTNYPADIVLLLDYSSSMYADIGDLRTAVGKFVKSIKESNNLVQRDKNGGHRLALVLFARNVFSGKNVHYDAYHNYNNGENVAAHNVNYSSGLNALRGIESFTVSQTNNNVYYSGDSSVDMIGCPIESGTNSPAAMQKAKDILSAAANAGDYTDSAQNPEDQSSKRARVVVMFTDGEPYTDNDTPRVDLMNQTENFAYQIKSSSAYGATIYTVGLFHNISEGERNYTTTYMSYVSSDYTDDMTCPNEGLPISNYVPVSGDYSIIVNNSSALDGIFSDLADIAGGDYGAASGSSVLVDVVATSFVIPEDADLGSVKVYAVPCTNQSAAQVTRTFSTNRDDWTPLTSAQGVTLTTDHDTGRVTVTGFDYGAEWCGWDASKNNNQGGPHGHKLLLEIPIMANVLAIGGFSIQTNAEGSALTVVDKAGNSTVYPYVSPRLSLPINIHIMKKGLAEGESAKFIIQRTTLPIAADPTWEYVSSVFVTNGDSSQFETAPDDNISYPITYVRGLPSAKTIPNPNPGPDAPTTINVAYAYRVIEEPWSWNYQLTEIKGRRAVDDYVTITDEDELKEGIVTNTVILNPIMFTNRPKTSGAYSRTRLHSESKATNVFKTEEIPVYDDFKTNTRP